MIVIYAIMYLCSGLMAAISMIRYSFGDGGDNAFFKMGTWIAMMLLAERLGDTEYKALKERQK